MQIQNALQQVGYSPQEIKIYLALLKMGETNIADLSHQAQIPRSSAKELLEGMHAKGLTNYYIKHGRHYWIAENPEKLVAILEERLAAFRSILPSLEAMKSVTWDKPRVLLYTGAQEIKLIMDDIIETKHHILALVSWDDWLESLGREYLDDFIERRYSHFLKIRFITPRTDLALSLKQTDAEELRHTRFLPPDIELRRTSNFIYGTKVAIISMNKKEPTGIVIEDSDVVHAMTIYFESLWLHCGEN